MKQFNLKINDKMTFLSINKKAKDAHG